MSKTHFFRDSELRMERVKDGWSVSCDYPPIPATGDRIVYRQRSYTVTESRADPFYKGSWWGSAVLMDLPIVHRGRGTCTCCGSQTHTKMFPYKTDMTSPEKVIGREMPLDDPRTHHLCFVCATTNISESNRSMFKSENRIMGQIANILLDAISSGKDPRDNYGDP